MKVISQRLNKRKVRVLSLDFDFFLKFYKDDSSVLSSFPDADEQSISISDILWAACFADDSRYAAVKTVGINALEERLILKYVLSQRVSIPFFAANSHAEIYSFIKDNIESCESLELVNIDYHHDAYYTNLSKVHCGNWLYFLRKDYNLKAYWVTSKNGWLSSAGTRPEWFDAEVPHFEKFGYFKRMHEDFVPDLIFMCRSDMWLPPTLDKSFDYMLKSFGKHFLNSTAERRILHPRSIGNHVKEIKASREASGKLDLAHGK